MSLRICPYCGQSFAPSLYHPKQLICSGKVCQSRRRTEYHKRKFHEDADYRDLCRDSQRIWREQNPDYMREYRKSRSGLGKCRPEQLLEHVKNNPALDLRRCSAEAWIVVPKGTRAKNTFASAQVIVFDVVGCNPLSAEPEKNILLALRNGNAYK
jgi:hypothetical protein